LTTRGVGASEDVNGFFEESDFLGFLVRVQDNHIVGATADSYPQGNHVRRDIDVVRTFQRGVRCDVLSKESLGLLAAGFVDEQERCAEVGDGAQSPKMRGAVQSRVGGDDIALHFNGSHEAFVVSTKMRGG